MSDRYALVIGNRNYPASAKLVTPRDDAEEIARALKDKDIGFDVSACIDLSYAQMKIAIKRFESALGQADVALLFFAGHAVEVSGENYLIPVDAPITTKHELLDSSFCLSEIIDSLRKRARRTLIFLDACRDNPFSQAGGSGQTTERTRSLAPQLAKVELPHDSGCFIAFSTSPGRIAYDGKADHSPFTAALLKHIKARNLPIDELMRRVSADVVDATGEQEPWRNSSLREPFCFVDTKPRRQRSDDAESEAPWPALDPKTYAEKKNTFHCLVVTAELPDSQSLNYQVRLMTRDGHSGRDIKQAAQHLWRLRQGMAAVSGEVQALEIAHSWLDTTEAFTTLDALQNAVRALCLADVAIFDITDLQPGVMFLLGIRSVARRGVTICSYGGDYVHGEALALPFNIQMLNVAAHSAGQARSDRRPYQILGRKIVRGLQDLANLPEYMDLPAYDPVRALGPTSFNRISMKEKVLILCPFTKAFQDRNWITLHDELSGEVDGSLVRLLDEDSPRLVTQTLYELIRRVDMCFIDWTGLRPNVMFELGVRLAVNPRGAVHIEDSDLPGDMDPLSARNKELSHVETLRGLFDILPYSSGDPKTRQFQVMVDSFVKGFNAPVMDQRPRDSTIYRTVGTMTYDAAKSSDEQCASTSVRSASSRTLEWRNSARLFLVQELVSRARLLANEDDSSSGMSSVLYADVAPQLRDRAKADARERMVAAWLYLDAHYSNEDIVADLELWRQFWKLGWAGRHSADTSDQPTDEHDRKIDAKIQKRLSEVKRPQYELGHGTDLLLNFADLEADVLALKREALALKQDREYASAIAALRDAVEHVEALGWQTDSSLSRERKSKIAWHLADCYGMIGGNYRRLEKLDDASRLEKLDDAIKAFERGREYEQDQRFAVPSSYNTVNLISAKIERDKSIADQQMREIQQAIDTLRHQINDPEMGANSRKTDRWAYADLGQCFLLRGDTKAVEAAHGAYQEFVRLSNASEIESSCSALRGLAEALVRCHDDAKAAVLDQGVQWLKAELKSRAA